MILLLDFQPFLFCGVLVSMSAGAIAATAAATGVAANIYGSAQQRKANAKAQDANQRQFDKSQNQDWINYLLTRGINPGSNPVTTGVIPTTGTTAVNTRLPLWATGSNFGPRTFRKAGTGAARAAAAARAAPSPAPAEAYPMDRTL